MSSTMNLNCPVTQTYGMNQNLHYQETPGNNSCASFQQSQVEKDRDSANTALEAFISTPNIHKRPDDFYLNNDWLAKLVTSCSTLATNSNKLATVVPNISYPNESKSCAQPGDVFHVEQGNISEYFAGYPNDSFQTMQDYILQIPSSAVTTENQAAVVPSSDNIAMLTHAGFLAGNIFPTEDIENGVSSIKNRTFSKNIVSTNLSTANRSIVSNVPQLKQEQTRQIEENYMEHVHEVPIVHKTRKPRKLKPLEKFNGNGVPLLWQFILQLLLRNTGDVCWTHRAPFEFKIVNPANVADLWGKVKGKKNMNYEKLSRSIRYYYRKNIISKDDRKQHVYRFVCDIVEILGYDPTVCPPKPDYSAASQNNTEETPKPCSTEQVNVNTGQGIPCSFPKMEVDANGDSGDPFGFDITKMVSNETFSSPNEPEIDVDGLIFSSEYRPISDEFFFSDNGLDVFSFEGLV